MDNYIYDDEKYLLNLFNKCKLEIVKANGSFLYDKDGNRYLDMFSGLSVNNFGHHNEYIIEKIYNQSTKYIHLSNFFVSEPVVNLAKLLVKNTFKSKVFFSNSGTEANEAAMKLAKKFGLKINDSKYEILSALGSFHGRTLGSLSITGQEKLKKNFYPLLPGTKHFKFNNIDDLKRKVNNNTCAVFIETIQGSGGINEVSQDFINELVNLSNEFNFLIVVDEIQTGLGRTGKFLSYERYGFTPHIITLAKSLGGGLPIGAMIVREDITNIFDKGDHGSTFGGNPIACSVGEYIVNTVSKEDFLNSINYKSEYLVKYLKILKDKYSNIIKEIRGIGLMIGLEVGKYSNIIRDLAIENNIFINITNKTVIRLLPPLTISFDEIDLFLETFDKILYKISKKNG